MSNRCRFAYRFICCAGLLSSLAIKPCMKFLCCGDSDDVQEYVTDRERMEAIAQEFCGASAAAPVEIEVTGAVAPLPQIFASPGAVSVHRGTLSAVREAREANEEKTGDLIDAVARGDSAAVEKFLADPTVNVNAQYVCSV